MVWLILLVGLLWWAPVGATCSGSGLAWTCTAGSTSSQVQSAVNSASDGATITFAAGSYTLSGVGLAGKNGITLICATVGGCNQTTQHPFEMGNDVSGNCAVAKTNVIRISGWNFTGTASQGHYFQWRCVTGQTKVLVRFDHNTFTNIGTGNRAIMLGEESNAVEARFIGVVDHNTFTASSGTNFFALHSAGGGSEGTWNTGAMGSSENIFFEDNVVSMPGVDDSTFGFGAIDAAGANSVVIRFNSFSGPVVREHSMCHGGPYSFETYGNIIDTSTHVNDGHRGFWNVHMQGSGEIMIWGNSVASGHSESIAVQHYRSEAGALPQGNCTVIADGTRNGSGTAASPKDGNRTPTSSFYGYPAWHQPGRDAAATLKPIYAFKNTFIGGSTNVPISISTGNWTGLQANCANNDSDRINCHIQLNRDIYQYNASFNGTSGTGVGPFDSRPANCTPTNTTGANSVDAGNGGVGYWATDQGSWNQSTSNPYGVQQNGADGVLYRCSATNTWTVAYTPYTYPHPLQGGVDTTPPAAPTGVTIAQEIP